MNKIKKKHGTNGDQNNFINIEVPSSKIDRSITPRGGNMMFSNQSNPRHKYLPSTSTTPRILS
jgi:hypothetical protein